MPASAWGWLPLLTGVALVDAIRTTTGIEAGVKWPNDILVGTGKLAGILAEVPPPPGDREIIRTATKVDNLGRLPPRW